MRFRDEQTCPDLSQAFIPSPSTPLRINLAEGKSRELVNRDGLTTDGAVRAERLDYGLNQAMPLRVEVFKYEHATPLRIDFHQGLEFGLVLEGEIYRQFEDLSFTAGPGEVWLCAMWEPHGWAILAPETVVVVILFLPEFLGDESFDGVSYLSMFSIAPRERPRITTDDSRQTVLAIGQELAVEIIDRPCAWKMGVRLHLLRILLLLRRNWEPKVLDRQTRELRPSDLSLILPALEILHSDPTRRVKVSEASSACSMGESTFIRKFQQVMGMPFRRFQLRAKLGIAAQRLVATDFSVETIAVESGFVNASHLIHAFAKYYDCTPAQYRRRAR